jgi:hypothetical protein
MDLHLWRPALLALGLALLAAPAAAQAATTYCVHQPADPCAAGTVDEGANLQAAMTAADQTNDNVVAVGAGTYYQVGGFNASGPGQRIQLIGAGAGRTILTAAAATSPVVRLDDGASGARLSGVTVVMTGTLQGGLVAARTDVDHVRFEMPATNSGFPAVQLDGGTLTDSTIVAAQPFGNQGTGVRSTGTATLERDTITAQIGVRAEAGALTAHDLRVTFGYLGVASEGAGTQATLDDGLLTATPDAVAPIGLLAEGGGDVAARSATILASATHGAGAEVNPAAGTTSSVTLQNSIVRGFPSSVIRTGGTGPGTASNLTLGNDDLTLPSDSGVPGTYTPNTNVDVDPAFVDPANGDYHLRWDSPVIDAGGVCQTLCQTVPDLDGLTRPIDGNGDGTAARDLGAYEYGHRAPVVTAAGSFPGTVAPNAGVLFTATGSDPDVGDPLVYTWTFDDGATATGRTVGHGFRTAGRHTASVRVTDPRNLSSASAVASVNVVAPPPKVIPDTTRPVLSRLELTHATFAVSSAATKVSARALARAAHAKKPPPRGTHVHFRLSETATVVLRIEHRVTSSSCVARAHRHHHSTKACTTYRRSGTFTRRKVRAGTASFGFSGRIGSKKLAHGRYRVRLSATDAAGNTTKANPEASFTIV